MKIAGASWVGYASYGTVFSGVCGGHPRLNDLYRSLLDRGILSEGTSKFGRFDGATQAAFCAAALALHDAGFSCDWKKVGLIGTGRDESTTANNAYFSDYAENGRRLGRANLFIYTLPTSPLAELAIHFKLAGPLFFTAVPSDPALNLMRTANRLLAEAEASHVLAVWTEKEVTAAFLLNSETGAIPENIQSIESPKQFIAYLKETL